MPTVFLGVGSNLPDRRTFLQKAEASLRRIPGVRFMRSSSVIETEPVGGPPQGSYLNAVWEIDTGLLPGPLLANLQKIESQLGRTREGKDFPRTIDLDILFYGQEVIREPDLIVPHPRAHERSFVLEPMAELEPDFVHPVLKKTMRQLLNHSNSHRSCGS